MKNSNKLQITPSILSKLENNYSRGRQPSAYLQELMKKTYQQSQGLNLLKKRKTESESKKLKMKPSNFISNNYFIKNFKIEHPYYHSLEPKKRTDKQIDLQSRSMDITKLRSSKKNIWHSYVRSKKNYPKQVMQAKTKTFKCPPHTKITKSKRCKEQVSSITSFGDFASTNSTQPPLQRSKQIRCTCIEPKQSELGCLYLRDQSNRKSLHSHVCCL